jgi:uncharacterized protein YjbI with pentapeptide repeats
MADEIQRIRDSIARGEPLRDEKFNNLKAAKQDLRGASFVRCTFDEADLSYANLEGAKFDECTLTRASRAPP